MKKLRIKRGVKAATFPETDVFMRAYSNVFGNPFVKCRTDTSEGRLYSGIELYQEIKQNFISGPPDKRQWAVSALNFFGL
jgi:hypothetical protein